MTARINMDSTRIERLDESALGAQQLAQATTERLYRLALEHETRRAVELIQAATNSSVRVLSLSLAILRLWIRRMERKMTR